MTISLDSMGLLGHLAASVGYLALALLAVLRARRALFGVLLGAAALVTAGWAAAVAYTLSQGVELGPFSQSLEILRSVGWMVLVLSMLSWISPVQRSSFAALILGGGVAVLAVTLIFGAGPIASSGGSPDIGDSGNQIVALGHLLQAMLGLLLVENLFRNTLPPRLWNVKHLCLGCGALFGYDFLFYSDALLFRHLDLEIFQARGITNLAVIPLLCFSVARNRQDGPKLAVSRQMALRSTTVIGAGLYLMVMSAAGYYVRRFGGDSATFLQAVFFFGAILLLTVPLVSGSFRAKLRVMVEKNFFKNHYDYREEWLRFIRMVATEPAGEAQGSDLPSRVIQSMCHLLDSPEGALWMRRDTGFFSLEANWNTSRWNLDPQAAIIEQTSDLIWFLESKRWTVDLNEYASSSDRYEGLSSLPGWLTEVARAWLVVPLIQGERLLGVIVLGQPRVARWLNWEDFDILKTIGRQAASYLALQASDRALGEARQFEAFNKRFAFVVHDIKNLTSQLSLILANTARHRGNAQFHDDVIETVRESVDKLNKMLRQLNAKAQPKQAPTDPMVQLDSLLQDVVAARERAGQKVEVETDSQHIQIVADREKLEAIIQHLIQNAFDAAGENGRIRLRLGRQNDFVRIDVEDDGPGMDAAFIRDQLFQPFFSTKQAGYGIGVYESREYIRSLGGRLEVFSTPGKGTTMRVSLPLVKPLAPAERSLRERGSKVEQQ